MFHQYHPIMLVVSDRNIPRHSFKNPTAHAMPGFSTPSGCTHVSLRVHQTRRALPSAPTCSIGKRHVSPARGRRTRRGSEPRLRCCFEEVVIGAVAPLCR